MSEGDVSLIRDEDVLRRLWQQTEDFSRKKEIRAHMYRLREERLRDLYTPEPHGDVNKGSEFTSPQGHVQSFADQNFQSMKSKEVRDAGSPPKEFTYCGQDLKALSNAGWNVDSENTTTDDGHTHVKSVNANIEGRYDVEGGKGQFTAVDQHRQAVTEYQDENSSLKRNESSSKTAAHEQVVRKTDDGSHFSSTKSSSSTSKFEQVSTRHETVPYADDYDRRTVDTNRNEQLTRDNYEQTLRKTDDHGELMSRKVEYPDDNTRVIVETRRLPDGTRVTSTRREFRAPVQSARSEHHSQTRSENKYSTVHKSDQTSTSKIIRHIDNSNDIVDKQRHIDNYDFKRQIIDDDVSEIQNVKNYETNSTRRVIDTTDDDHYSATSRHETSRVTKKMTDDKNIDNDYSTNRYEKINKIVTDHDQTDDVDIRTIRHEINKQHIDQSNTDDKYSQTIRYVTKTNQGSDDFEFDQRPNRRPDSIDNGNRREATEVRNDKNINKKDIKDTEERIRTVTRDTKEHTIDRKTTSDQYQTTYHTDYSQKKISTDWSPSHQAWASTLRSDTPPTTRPSTRASSPGSKTFKSSNSSLRSSVSPDKSSRKPSSRGNSPNKVDRYSPSRTVTDRYSSTHSSHSVTEVKSSKHTTSGGRPPIGRSPTRSAESPDRKLQHHRPSVSPDKSHNSVHKFSSSPEGKVPHKPADSHPRSPTRPRQSPDRKPGYQPTSEKPGYSTYPRATSPQRYTSDNKVDGRPKDLTDFSPSPERKTDSTPPTDRQTTPSRDIPRTSPSRPYYPDDTQKTPRASPDRKPGYQPTSKKSGDSTHLRTTSPQRFTSDKKLDGRPKDFTRFTPSPERKPDSTPSTVCQSTPTDIPRTRTSPSHSDYPDDTHKRPSISPDRKPGYQATSEKSGDSAHPQTTSPQRYTSDKKLDGRPKDFTRFSPSPERKTESATPRDRQTTPSKNIPRARTSPSSSDYLDDTQKRPSISPDRKPGYKPFETHPEKNNHNTPQKQNSGPDRKPEYIKSIPKDQPNENLYKKSGEHNDSTRITKVKEDHYKFVDEETKVYTSTEKIDIQKVKPDHVRLHEKSPSPIRKIPREESPDKEKTLRNTEPFQQPGQNMIILDENHINTHDSKKILETRKHDVLKEVSVHTSKFKQVSKPGREPSPSKYNTHDKNKPDDLVSKNMDETEVPGLRESSPNKYGTYDKKHPHDKAQEVNPKDKHAPKSPLDRELSPTKFRTSDRKKAEDEVKDSSPKDNNARPDREFSPTKYGTYDRKHPQDKERDTNKDKHIPKSQTSRETSPTKFGTFDNNHPYDDLKDFSPKDKDSPNSHKPQKESSPTKHGRESPSYDIRHLKDSIKSNNTTYTKEEKVMTIKETKDTKYNSLTLKKQTTKQSPEQATSPTKKTPRDSVSPVKSPQKETKYKETTDFLATERKTEETIKKTPVKGHPRQLVTPSSSPTRKHKPETEPSTGHSSPTTSVSGFVYFGSPPREKTEVTDLDDQNDYSETLVTEVYKTGSRPDSLDIQRSPSPSKIPCRSPSPEKQIAPSKDSLPRKSSLKKPSEYYGSPTEKPPSSFRISPNDDQDYSHNKIVKKDRPEPEGEEKTCKPKMPLERRETYEERCKKILGMMDETETVTKQTTVKSYTDTTLKSPSVSPCESPAPRDSSPHKDGPVKKDVRNVTEFITHEKENIIKITRPHDMPPDEKGKTPSAKSPTKLQDIITVTKSVDKYDIKKNLRDSPERKPNHIASDEYAKPGNKTTCELLITEITQNRKPDLISVRPEPESPSRDDYNTYPKDSSIVKLSPERKPDHATITTKLSTIDIQESVTSTTTENKYFKPDGSPTGQTPKSKDNQTRSTSPSKHVPKENTPKRDLSPTKEPTNDVPTNKPGNMYPRASSPKKPDIIPGYMKTTASVTSRHDTYDSEDIQESVISKIVQEQFPRKSSESPTHKTSEDIKPSDVTQTKIHKKPDQKDYRLPSPTKSDKDSTDHEKVSTLIKQNTITIGHDQEKTSTETVKERYTKRPTESPTRRSPREDEPKNVSPSRPKTVKVGTPEQRSDEVAPKSPTSNYPEDVSPISPKKIPGYMKTTTTYSSKHEPTEDVEKTSIQKVDNKIPRSSDSPVRQYREPDKFYSDRPTTTSPTKTGRPKDNTRSRNSLSPERKSVYQPLISNTEQNEFDENESPDNYPQARNNISLIKTNTSITTEHATNLSSQDIEETVISKTVRKKYPSKQSVPQVDEYVKIPSERSKTASPDKPSSPKNSSPVRDSISPEKQPIDQLSSPIHSTSPNKLEDRYPKDSSPTKPEKSTDHTKTTTTYLSQRGKVEEIVTSKVTERSPRYTGSPTRDNPEYSKSLTRKATSPERETGAKDTLKKESYKYPKDTSPTRNDKPVNTYTLVSSKCDITNTSEETISSKINSKKQITTQSLTHDSPEHKSEPHYQRENSPYTTRRPSQKSPIRESTSPEKEQVQDKPKRPFDETLKKKRGDKYPHDTSPSRLENVPGYMKTTISDTFINDTSLETNNFAETVKTTNKSIEKHYPSRSPESSPSRKTKEYIKSTPEQIRPASPLGTKPLKNKYTEEVEVSKRKPGTEKPQNLSSVRPVESPSYVKSTTTKQFDDELTTTIAIEKKHTPRPLPPSTSKIAKTYPGHPRNTSPTKSHTKDVSASDKLGLKQPSTPRDSPMKNPNKEEKHPKASTPVKPEDKKPAYMKPTKSVTSKYETTTVEDGEEYITSETVEQHPSPRSTLSPTRHAPEETSKPVHYNKPEEVRQLRTPSPIKKVSRLTEASTDFITSEREQEILDRVQKSLRTLSPDRKNRSPSPDKSPIKTTTSSYDLDIKKTIDTTQFITDETSETREVTKGAPHSKPKEEKLKEPKSTSKPRTVSPIKKPGMVSPIKADKGPESSTKSRSISPKKPFSERPQSPHILKTGSVKPKEQVPVSLTRKPTPITITTMKIEKAITMDVKKTIGTTKQTITKTSVKATASKFMSNTKVEPDTKRVGTPKAIKEYPKKDNGSKVTHGIRDSKKNSPQRAKSKPEIQVNDLPSPKTPKSAKEPQTKFPGKPKSATSLNTSTDEDDVIIDVQQSKSSRENSPDRICPTPVNFLDDVGTPRFPDQVSEPDDDLRRRIHHTIHETESLVDDIVEICEEDELFVKKTNVDISDRDESLLSVHDKVSKFTNKIETDSKPKDSTASFKDIEIKHHSDVTDHNIRSDECLLSVSEKVNKFAKGPRDSRDSKSPSRRIVDEYDKNTIYQDDYTKLSVNDKAHLFVETAENVKSAKTKPAQKVERPDLSNVDESLKSDDCLLSVSDKVNKFVKTAEQFFVETHEVEEKDKRIKEQHDKLMKQIVDDYDDETMKTTIYTEEIVTETVDSDGRKSPEYKHEKPLPTSKVSTPSQPKVTDHNSPNLKPADRAQPIKITTLRSSEAVKKAKALFENIASTTRKPKDSSKPTTKLTDIGIKKVPKTDTPDASRPVVDDFTTCVTDLDTDFEPVLQDHRRCPSRDTPTRLDETKHRSSPSRVITESPETPRSKSPTKHTAETTTITKTVVKHPAAPRSESPKHRQENDKPDKTPGYLRPTKTSQIKEEKVIEEIEVSTRRGSGKFGVELRKTSIDRAAPTTERRRSIEHPCIEDIYDLELLEQMLEKVVGYEQRRRIRAQIRVARKGDETNTFTKSTKTTLSVQKNKFTDSHKSPERSSKASQKTMSPDRKAASHKTSSQPREEFTTNGHSKEPTETPRTARPESPDKATPKSSKASSRQPSPEKKTRPQSPAKTTAKPKPSRFNEYATAYMNKVGLNETSKPKTAVTKRNDVHKTLTHVEEHTTVENYSTAKFITERTTSKDVIEAVHDNGKRSLSPEKRGSPERYHSPRQERSPSPARRNSETAKETIIKRVYEVEKNSQPKVVQEEKPSWVTGRNLKKVTSEARTFNQKKIEPEKPKYRATSPSKIIAKPIDAITSSYGPGPLDSDGKPLFGIRALRNGATNYQVKGTVIRQEFHSRNGGEPEGTVSVTAYSTEPEELERLLQAQGAPPSRLHGLAAITTTKKFGGDSGSTIQQAHGKEERAALEQFTHSDRRVSGYDLELEDREMESRRFAVEEIENTDEGGETIYRETVVREHRTDGQLQERQERMEIKGDKKTVRQNSVKSLTEKYIKSANESSKPDRSSYPKAGLILRTATMKDSISSDSSAHAGLARTDSEQSLGSADGAVLTSTSERVGDGVRTSSTTSTTSTRHQERSFLDNSSKVTGVQDILARMKNADIVIQEGDTTEDTEARALLNKFLGASVLMAGMQGYVSEKPAGKVIVKQETVRSGGGKGSSTRTLEELDLEQCWDERELKQLLEECSDYEQRRRLRARLRTLMAEQEACASAVSEALAAAEENAGDTGDAREETEVTVTSSVRRDSSEKTVSSTTTTKTSKVIESVTRPAGKTVSPFAKFRQLEKQNSTTSPNSPKTPQSPGSPSKPFFKFTDPALQASALTIKERLLQWCRDKTRDYENVKLENFSTSWADGLAFCALLHHFLPHAFDYSQLTADRRRHNFTLAFKIADEKAGIYPLLDVEDMVTMRKPDWKCVFTYVQSIHRRFKDQD